jgi:hypothetical protein
VARGSSSSGNKEDMLRCTNSKVKQEGRECTKVGNKGDRRGNDTQRERMDTITSSNIAEDFVDACSISVRKSSSQKRLSQNGSSQYSKISMRASPAFRVLGDLQFRNAGRLDRPDDIPEWFLSVTR